ncbi:hypothetical protein PGT21_022894 [Puccinia graminis f. sp. tritici]|uniref:Uncharacterized protein n=1 Tax=Puccinia graminis f. sp. tritici TaxID=56615 RepID=A0A5B0N377_PUCGR|nr:hypothetical protein PGT21_022894 [Puccinia graminis f. sp. tritici]KAA1124052.1 hypothetical protein PGTUg99_023919 [Puccinia graminis f. sp. tritici]
MTPKGPLLGVQLTTIRHSQQQQQQQPKIGWGVISNSEMIDCTDDQAMRLKPLVLSLIHMSISSLPNRAHWGAFPRLQTQSMPRGWMGTCSTSVPASSRCLSLDSSTGIAHPVHLPTLPINSHFTHPWSFPIQHAVSLMIRVLRL